VIDRAFDSRAASAAGLRVAPATGSLQQWTSARYK